MCGIFGKLYFQKTKITPEKFLPLFNTLTHRGPDDSGYYVDDNIFLGSRRLAIIDLSSRGRMPMTNEDQSLWIVFNGEIYNFLEIRRDLETRHRFQSRSDTEVILHLYEEKGIDCLQFLRGMFSFAIWDKKKKILFVARDRLGKKPIKYFLNNRFFIFASELKAIIQDPQVKTQIDYSAIDEYLIYQYVPHPKTGFVNIFKLEPAHYLIVSLDGKVTKKRYWDLNFEEKMNLQECEYIEMIENKLKEAVRLRLISDVPIGAHLSGGIDSSMVVAFMSREMKEPVKTFSIGFPEQEYSEIKFARLVAERYRTNHQEFIVEPKAIEVLPKIVYHYEEPYGDSSALPTWYLCDITSKFVKVALNGDGGDENFAGYPRYNVYQIYNLGKIIPAKEFWQNLFQWLFYLTKIRKIGSASRLFSFYRKNKLDFYLNLIGYFTEEDKKRLYQRDFQSYFIESRREKFLQDIWTQAPKNNWLDQVLYLEIHSYLVDDLLVKVDIASMAHSLEIRSPYLDHEFMELMAKIPPELKLRGFSRKYIFKKLAQKYLPLKCIRRPKQGFGIPVNKWFRKDLVNYFQQTVLENKKMKEIFQISEIKNLLILHQKGKINCGYKLWLLLTLAHWFDIFAK